MESIWAFQKYKINGQECFSSPWGEDEGLSGGEEHNENQFVIRSE